MSCILQKDPKASLAFGAYGACSISWCHCPLLTRQDYLRSTPVVPHTRPICSGSSNRPQDGCQFRVAALSWSPLISDKFVLCFLSPSTTLIWKPIFSCWLSPNSATQLFLGYFRESVYPKIASQPQQVWHQLSALHPNMIEWLNDEKFIRKSEVAEPEQREASSQKKTQETFKKIPKAWKGNKPEGHASL